MPFPLTSVVRRHMRKTERFREAATVDELPVSVPLARGESLIGWYSNPSPWDKCFVVFTDKAIYSVEDGSCIRIDLNDVVDYEFPKSKTNVSGVRVLTPDGFTFVRIAGSRGPEGRYKDAFDFVMVVAKLAGRRKGGRA